MDGGLPVKIAQGYPLDPSVDSEYPSPFSVAIANAFLGIRNLAGIQSAIVTEIAAITVDLRFPLHPGGWGKVGDSEFMSARLEFSKVGTKSADGPIHNVAGDPLYPTQEIGIVLPIEGAVVGTPVANIGVVEALGDVGEIVGIVLESFANGDVRIGCRPVLGHVKPAGTKIIVPLAPGHPILIIGGVYLHGQTLLAQIVNAGSPLGVGFDLADGRQ